MRPPPRALVILAALAASLFAVPLAALVLRAPWARLPEVLSSEVVGAALRISLISSLVASALSALLGLPLAWVLARVPFPGRSVLRALVTLPLVLPPVVGGVALLLALGRLGLVGRALDSLFGVTLFGTLPAVIVAETFVAMPFLVLTVEGALKGLDPRYEDAAATLGASRGLVFWRVTLPLVAPSVAAGAVLAWARALGEFGATITFAGNLPGETQTMPIAVYSALLTDVDAAIVLSLVLVAVSLLVLVTLRERWTPEA